MYFHNHREVKKLSKGPRASKKWGQTKISTQMLLICFAISLLNLNGLGKLGLEVIAFQYQELYAPLINPSH